jgi:hydroxymethylpyrimidine pyrophosphatase-like HAD family hydrolase
MKIVFDLQGTITGIIDDSLRPKIVDTINALRSDGHEVYFWTGSRRYYAGGIEGQIFSKFEALPFNPDIYVDDSEEIVKGRTLIVNPHISAIVPGSHIDVKEILNFCQSIRSV